MSDNYDYSSDDSGDEDDYEKPLPTFYWIYRDVVDGVKDRI